VINGGKTEPAKLREAPQLVQDTADTQSRKQGWDGWMSVYVHVDE
jgi:hypothetical protein